MDAANVAARGPDAELATVSRANQDSGQPEGLQEVRRQLLPDNGAAPRPASMNTSRVSDINARLDLPMSQDQVSINQCDAWLADIDVSIAGMPAGCLEQFQEDLRTLRARLIDRKAELTEESPAPLTAPEAKAACDVSSIYVASPPSYPLTDQYLYQCMQYINDPLVGDGVLDVDAEAFFAAECYAPPPPPETFETFEAPAPAPAPTCDTPSILSIVHYANSKLKMQLQPWMDFDKFCVALAAEMEKREPGHVLADVSVACGRKTLMGPHGLPAKMEKHNSTLFNLGLTHDLAVPLDLVCHTYSGLGGMQAAPEPELDEARERADVRAVAGLETGEGAGSSSSVPAAVREDLLPLGRSAAAAIASEPSGSSDVRDHLASLSVDELAAYLQQRRQAEAVDAAPNPHDEASVERAAEAAAKAAAERVQAEAAVKEAERKKGELGDYVSPIAPLTARAAYGTSPNCAKLLSWQANAPYKLTKAIANGYEATVAYVDANPDECSGKPDCPFMKQGRLHGPCECTRTDRLIAAWHGSIEKDHERTVHKCGCAHAAQGAGKTLVEAVIPLLVDYTQTQSVCPPELRTDDVSIITFPSRVLVDQIRSEGLGVLDKDQLENCAMHKLAGIPVDVLYEFNRMILFLDEVTADGFDWPTQRALGKRVLVGTIQKTATILAKAREKGNEQLKDRDVRFLIADEAHLGIGWPKDPWTKPNKKKDAAGNMVNVEGSWQHLLVDFPRAFVVKFSGSKRSSELKLPNVLECRAGELMRAGRSSIPVFLP